MDNHGKIVKINNYRSITNFIFKDAVTDCMGDALRKITVKQIRSKSEDVATESLFEVADNETAQRTRLSEGPTPREDYILQFHLYGKRHSDPTILMRLLKKQIGEQIESAWQDSGRAEQATRVYNEFPDSLPAYFAYEFKGETSRVDELKTIDHLLEKESAREDKICPPEDGDEIEIDCAPTAASQKVLSEATIAVQVLFAAGDLWMYTRGGRLRFANKAYTKARGILKRGEVMRIVENVESLLSPIDFQILISDYSFSLCRTNLGHLREADFATLCAKMEDGKLNIGPDDEDLPITPLSASTAIDLLSLSIEYAILYGNKDERRLRRLDFVLDIYSRLVGSFFNSCSVGVNPSFLDDLVDKTGANISSAGSEREASLIYRLDDSLRVLSLNTCIYDERKETIAKAVLVKAFDQDQEYDRGLLVVDNIFASDGVELLRKRDASADKADWRELMYEQVVRHAFICASSEKIVVNVFQDPSNQKAQEFVKYVADRQGMKEGADYTFTSRDGQHVFRLTEEGYRRLSAKRLPNGMRYTHHARKLPLDSRFVQQLSKSGWKGEMYLNSWLLSDAYEYLMRVKSENSIETDDPCGLVEIVRSTPGLREDFERREFNWTMADGCITGIEIDTDKEFYIIEDIEECDDESDENLLGSDNPENKR